jgi:glycogen debranching enzyme
MDNSPRNPYLDRGGTAVDASAEMVLFARNLADIAALLGKQDDATAFRAEADELARLINGKMWSPARRFYFDLTVDGKQSPIRTVAAFWTLLAGVAGPEQIQALKAELRDPRTFGRLHRVPTVPADEKAFKPAGGYWEGAVWAPIDTMVVRGLERCGERQLAREIALEHLKIITRVFRETGTIWENYAPDAARPGTPAAPDFVGWSGLGPILYLIEYGIGIQVDAPSDTITWTIRSPRRVGVERLWFGGKTASLISEEPDAGGRRSVRIKSDGPFRLRLSYAGAVREMDVPAGRTLELQIAPPPDPKTP